MDIITSSEAQLVILLGVIKHATINLAWEKLCIIASLFTNRKKDSRFLCPGCWSQGAIEAETIENIKEAIREYLAVVDEQLQGEQVHEIESTV